MLHDKYAYVKTVNRDWALILRGLSVRDFTPSGTVCKALDYWFNAHQSQITHTGRVRVVSMTVSFSRTFLPFQGIPIRLDAVSQSQLASLRPSR